MKQILDRDLSDRRWNLYLKKYHKKYRCFIDEIGIWSIKCRYGFIQPYSVVQKKLVAVLTYKSSRGINILLNHLQSDSAPDFIITQHGDFEINICTGVYMRHFLIIFLINIYIFSFDSKFTALRHSIARIYN